MTVRASDRDGHVVAHDLRGDHRQGLALGGVHLSGHDARSRLVLGQAQLAESTAGSRAEEANVVRDLHERDGEDVERTRGLDDSVMRRERLELVGRGVEGEASDLGNLKCDLDVESLTGVESLCRPSENASRRARATHGADGGSSLSEE